MVSDHYLLKQICTELARLNKATAQQNKLLTEIRDNGQRMLEADTAPLRALEDMLAQGGDDVGEWQKLDTLESPETSLDPDDEDDALLAEIEAWRLD